MAEFDERLWGRNGGLYDGGRGWRHDDGVPGWDGDLSISTLSGVGRVLNFFRCTKKCRTDMIQ